MLVKPPIISPFTNSFNEFIKHEHSRKILCIPSSELYHSSAMYGSLRVHISYKIIAKLYTSPICVALRGGYFLKISGAIQSSSGIITETIKVVRAPFVHSVECL